MRSQAATVVDIAALYGVSPSTIRKWAKKHSIEPTGQWWKANLYNPRDFINIVKPEQRKPRKRRGWGK